MWVDFLFAIAVLLAIFIGFRRGLVVSLFSVAGLVIGLAAAMKLSTVVAHRLEDSMSVSARWMPFVSFLIVFISVLLIVRLVANMIQRSLEYAKMGWLNRMAGILLYLAIYLAALSVVLFFVVHIGLFDQQDLSESITYNWIQPWGPWVVNHVGDVIPIFSNMFEQLERFFEKVSHNLDGK